MLANVTVVVTQTSCAFLDLGKSVVTLTRFRSPLNRHALTRNRTADFLNLSVNLADSNRCIRMSAVLRGFVH